MKSINAAKIEDCIGLRKQGCSLGEIANLTGLGKSTVSVLVRNVPLNKKAVRRIEKLKKAARKKASIIRMKKIDDKVVVIRNELLDLLQGWKTLNKEQALIICSLLYWAEGSKKESCVTFTNSDPHMVQIFLYCFRKAFEIDEQKIRALIHLHEYHIKDKEKNYWSQITNIPLSRFNNSYMKPHTAKRERAEYHGTIRIRYYNSEIATRLKMTYNVLSGLVLRV